MKKIALPSNFSLINCHSLRIFSILAIFLVFSNALVAQKDTKNNTPTLITLSVKNKELKSVFRELEKKTNYFIIYNDEVIDPNLKVTIQVKNETIESAMKKLLEGQNLQFKIEDRQIIIYKNSTIRKNNLSDPVSNELSIHGKVFNEQSQPLVGVTVRVLGSSSGTVTDLKGEFTMKVSATDASLSFSYVGYKTIVMKADDDLMNIRLAEDTRLIDEVVVIGYGSQKRKEITGAVSTLRSEEVAKISVASFDQAIQGQVAGVQVIQSNGAPGAPIQVRIRGIGTIGDSDPLYVIDGVPTKEGINSINTNDIESISVLKDASSAAIYGARAANGIVLVTTKKGKTGVSSVNLDVRYGIQSVAKKLDLLTADQYAMISDEALINAGKPAVWNNRQFGAGTDWQDEIFRTAEFQKYDFSIASGNDKSRYLMGVGYYNQEGVVKFSDFKRYNLRFNLDSKVTDRLTTGFNLNVSRTEENKIDTEINGVVRAAIFQPPTIPVYKTNGEYAGPGANEGDAQNPVGMAERSNLSQKRNQLFGNLFAELAMAPGLKLKSNLGLNVYSNLSKNFDPTFTEGNANRTINSLFQESINYYDITWENTLNYSTTVNEKHAIEGLLGNTLQQVSTDLLSGYREGFSGNNSYLQYLNAGSGNDKARGNLTEWSLASFFGRVNYSFANKYLVSANVRLDGSSRFGKSNRWGVFPSASAGWRISEESFFNIPQIDDLKLRASWGQLGNQDIGLYAFSSVMAQSFYTFGNPQVLNVAYSPASAFNPDVKWETTTQQDIGVDLTAFSSKLSLSVDYYNKKTTDMLLILPQAMTSGFGATGYENLGSIENKGFEIQVVWNDRIDDFRYSVSANLSTVRNKVLSLGTLDKPIKSGIFFDLATQTEVGRSIREFYGYVTDGIFQNQSEINAHAVQPGAVPGDIRFKDLNNDKIINSDDRTYIGNPYPDFFYGINANFGYKNFDFSMLLQGQQGNDVYNATKFWLTNPGYNYNKGTQILKRWTGEGSSTTEPRLSTVDANQNTRASDRYIEDGSYLRLKDIQLGYTLPEQLVAKAGLSKLRIYVSGLNLLTFTNYTGYDPEVGMVRTGDRTIGFDEVTYPQNKGIMMGVNVSF